MVSNDETFRGGEHYNQQSFRDIQGSVNTVGSMRTKKHLMQAQLISGQGHPMDEVAMSKAGSTVTDQLSSNEERIHGNVNAALGRLKSENDFLNEQMHALNFRFASMKFMELAEKLWLKQKLKKIHENLVQAVGQNPKKSENSSLNNLELVCKIKELSKRMAKEANPAASQHQMSRGLSKMSDIDSSFQISKVSPRGGQHSTISHHQPFGAYGGQPVAPGQPNVALFKTLNHQASVSTLKTKDDAEHLQEVETQLKQQKEESETIIGNLMKTQKELVSQIKDLEQKLTEAPKPIQYTPSLANISPRAKSEITAQQVGKDLKFLESQLALKETSSQLLKQEVNEKEAALAELKSSHEVYTKSLREQFQNRVTELQKELDDKRLELASQVNQAKQQHGKILEQNSTIAELTSQFKQVCDDKERLEMETMSQNRQLQVIRSQVQTDQRTLDNNQRQIQQAKDQEKHWKCGYEQIFQKYQKLKEQLAKKEESMQQQEADHGRKLKKLTKRAEEAIQFFKNVALTRSGPINLPEQFLGTLASQEGLAVSKHLQSTLDAPRERDLGFELHEAEPRLSRFSRNGGYTESKPSVADHHQYRSKSVHSPPSESEHGISQKYQASAFTRAGQVTPARESQRSSAKDRGSLVRLANKSYSPIRLSQGEHASLLDGRTLEAELAKRRGSMSPGTSKRLTYIEQIQKKLKAQRSDSADKRPDFKILLCLEAIDAAFNEVTRFKQQCQDLSSKYMQHILGQNQKVQVLTYDYRDQIDQFLERERELISQVEQKGQQIGQLKEIVAASRKLIQNLISHVNEQKTLKESQWQNIISYDEMKTAQKAILKNTILEEVQNSKQMLGDLMAELTLKDQAIEEKAEHLEELETSKICIENQLNQTRNQLEQSQMQLSAVMAEKENAESRLADLELNIKDLASFSGNMHLHNGVLSPTDSSRNEIMIEEQHRSPLAREGMSGQEMATSEDN